MFFLPFLSFFGWGWFYKKPHKCKCEVTPQNLRLYWPSSSSPASPKFAVLDFILTQFSGGPCAQDRYPFIGNTQREGEKTNKKELLTCMINPWKSSVTTPRPFAANQSPCNTWNLFILEKKKHGIQKLPDEGNRSLRTHGKLHQQWELC